MKLTSLHPDERLRNKVKIRHTKPCSWLHFFEGILPLKKGTRNSYTTVYYVYSIVHVPISHCCYLPPLPPPPPPHGSLRSIWPPQSLAIGLSGGCNYDKQANYIRLFAYFKQWTKAGKNQKLLGIFTLLVIVCRKVGLIGNVRLPNLSCSCSIFG